MTSTPRLRRTVFARCPWLFHATVAVMLLFFALALVHEAIPGLCAAPGGDAAKCPFCNLIHVLALAATLFVYAHIVAQANRGPIDRALFPSLPAIYPSHAPRAPPAPSFPPAS